MELDERERYLLAITIFEWIETERGRVSKLCRESDADHLQEILEREFPDELKMVKAGREICAELANEANVKT